MVVTGERKSFFCALSRTREQSQKKTSHIVYSKLIIIFHAFHKIFAKKRIHGNNSPYLVQKYV